MGQIQSQDQDGSSNLHSYMESGTHTNVDKNGVNCDSDRKELSKKTGASSQDLEQFRCVKTRIDKLIEDCLICENSGEQKKDKVDVTVNDIKNEIKVEVKTEKVETYVNDKEKNDCGKDATHIKILCDDDSSAGGCEEKDGKCKESEGKEKGMLDQMKVSDIISEMVSTKLTATHMYQLQKKTITTFNTFIDKVLDSTLQKEMVHEEVKTLEPSIIKLCTQSMMQADNESESKRKSGNNEKQSAAVVVNNEIKAKRSKITLKDHIEKLLEESIQKEMFSDNSKREIIGNEGKTQTHKSETFNAQGILNDMILQALKGGASKEWPQNETVQRINMDNEYKNQRPLKPVDKLINAHLPSGFNGLIASKDTHSSEKVPQNCVNYDSHGPHNHHSAIHDVRHGHTHFSEKHEVRDHNNIQPVYANRQILQDRNEHMGKLVNRHPPESYNHLHPYAEGDYFRGGFAGVGQAPDPRMFSGRDGKPVHHPRDCTCSICLRNSHQSPHPNKLEHPHYEPSLEKHSPNLPPHLSHIYGQVMPASGHAAQSPKYSPHQPVPKLTPHHPLAHSKEHMAHLLPPSDGLTSGIPNNRRSSFSEIAVPTPVYRRNNSDDSVQHEGRYYKTPPLGLGNVSAHSHPVVTSERPSPGRSVNYSPRQKEYNRTLSSQSGGSDSSDGPLDLSVKRPAQEPVRSRSSSNSAHIPIPSKRGNVHIVNSFIKHLENSVDKYWQEINSPESSPGISPSLKYLHPSAEQCGVPPSSIYHSHSPNMASPQGSTGLPQQRFPSPHFTGGITVGQPLVNLERNTHLAGETTQYPNFRSCPSPQSSGNQLSGNGSHLEASRSASNHVSKHEPIQNIIGQHDPNDILYLICRLCTQTYGSPYAFRKHFRSNHGFEPRNKHTIVQTISATKTAMHVPQTADVQEVNYIQRPQVEKSRTPITDGRSTTYAHSKGSVSPDDTKSQTSSEDGETNIAKKSATPDKSETKCLECPECGKTFQLNDFGSYKRHCRQHGGTRMNGPFTCTHCRSHFSDQKLLKEHHLLHLKELPVDLKQNSSPGVESKADTKIESLQTGFCTLCNIQFEGYLSYSNHSCSKGKKESEVVNSGKTNKKGEKMCADSIKKEGSPDTKSRQSPDVVTSHSGTVKSAAESMTSQVCPDSSWDNVVKGDATSNNPDDACPSEDRSFPKSESAEKLFDRTTKSSAVNSESSDANTEDSQDCAYKHKKFFRKRGSLSSQDGPEAKVTRLDNDSDSSSVKAQVSIPGKLVGTVNSDSCDSSGLSDNGSTTSSLVDKTKRAFGKIVEVKEQKSLVVEAKLEARHNLPFVWDRPTRAQKK